MESGRSISGEEFDDVGVGFPGVGGFGGGGGGGGIDEGFIGDNSDSNYPTDDGAYSLCLNGTNLTLSSMYCNNTTGQAFPEAVGESNLETIVSIVVPILFGIIFVVGLFGNALVVIVVASNKQMRNTTNILIINLAMADLLFIIFCVPFTAADYVLSYWPFGVIWCKTVQYFIIVTAYVSVYTLVIMSVDRFLAVVYPVASISIRTEHNTYWAISITWAVILLSCLPAFPAHDLTEYTYAYERHASCTFNTEYNHALFQISFMLTSYAIPLTIICFLYFGMLFRLWKSVSTAGSSGRSIRGKKRVTRMVVVVVGVFAICWLPIQVVLVLKSLKLYEITDISVAIQITAHVLGYMNSCVNPLIYSVLSENFRKAFRKVIQCKFLFPSMGGAGGHGGSQIIKPRPSNVHLHPPSGIINEISCSNTGNGNGFNSRKGSGGNNTGENTALILNEAPNKNSSPKNKISSKTMETALMTCGNGTTAGTNTANHYVTTWSNSNESNSFDKQVIV